MKKKKIKILYVNGGLMDRGGVSSVMMNLFNHLDKETFQIDFLVHGYGDGCRDKEIVSNSSKIFKVPPKSKEPLKNYKMVKKIIMDGKYDIVHSHADSGNAYILKIDEDVV